MGAVIEIPLGQLNAALNRTERKVRRAIARGALAGAHRGRAIVVKATPVDMGPMKASWKVDKGMADFAGNASGTLATLSNDSPYIAAVELGSKPHGMSPQGWAATYEWVRRHYRGGRLGGTGRMRARRKVMGPLSAYHGDDPVIAGITNAIVHRIKVEGTPARLFVRNSLPDVRAAMIVELELALARAEEGPS